MIGTREMLGEKHKDFYPCVVDVLGVRHVKRDKKIINIIRK